MIRIFILNLSLLIFVLSFSSSAQAKSVVSAQCTYKDIKLFGKVEVVENFPDLKVQVVEHFQDLKVKSVSHFPDACGKWQFVDHFPDFKIKYVNHFPDIKIKMVDHFPGRP